MIYSEVHLEDSNSPLLAFAIHAGHYLPPGLLDTCGIDEATRFGEEDPFTDGFAGLFPNRITVQTSRFTADLNRSPEKAVYLKPEDAWGLLVRKAEPGAEQLAELHKAYENWYSMVRYQVDRLLEKHLQLIVLDLHSYNHRRGGQNAEPDPQLANPDIIIGRNILPPEVYPRAEQLRALLDGKLFQGKPLDCRCDVKFTGGYFSRWLNHSYGERVFCLAIEFKKIFMDEWTGKLDWHAWKQLQNILYQAVQEWLSL